jgi:hypothetical protein
MTSSLHLSLFHRPRLRSGVVLINDENGVDCVYREQGCRIDTDSPVELLALLRDLRAGGASEEELAARHAGLADEVAAILSGLDTLGLLTETATPLPEGVVTGAQMYRELRRLADRHHDRVVSGPMYRAMQDGSITRQQLIGYALEYYHVVSAAPRLVAPALAKEEPSVVMQALRDFYVSELHHDRLIEQSLASVGIDREVLSQVEPLPMTFALCASLGAYAAQSPMSFKAVLHLFEEAASDFTRAFSAAAAAVGLPPEFVKPIVAHARLNDDQDHGNITATLLGAVPAVSAEEAVTVKKHLAILIETFAHQEDEMMAYYADADARVPRVFQ